MSEGNYYARRVQVDWLNNTLHASTDLRGPLDFNKCMRALVTNDAVSERYRVDHAAMLMAIVHADASEETGLFLVHMNSGVVIREVP
jgi:D-mannonate dehydratase